MSRCLRTFWGIFVGNFWCKTYSLAIPTNKIDSQTNKKGVKPTSLPDLTYKNLLKPTADPGIFGTFWPKMPLFSVFSVSFHFAEKPYLQRPTKTNKYKVLIINAFILFIALFLVGTCWSLLVRVGLLVCWFQKIAFY